LEESHALIHIPGVPSYVTYSWLAMVILIGISLVIRKSIRPVPTGMQNFIESLVESLYKLCVENMGQRWADSLFPWIGTIFMYILICNFMGLIPGFESPTSNINMTASMAVPVFFLTHIYGVRVHGLNYVKHFLGPIRSILALPLMVLMFFVEFIGHLVRPVTLSVRLFGNMMAKHILLGVLYMLSPWVLPILILILGTLVSIIQAFVFTLLATLYLAGAVEEAH